jgi:hypothetical protein
MRLEYPLHRRPAGPVQPRLLRSRPQVTAGVNRERGLRIQPSTRAVSRAEVAESYFGTHGSHSASANAVATGFGRPATVHQMTVAAMTRAVTAATRPTSRM